MKRSTGITLIALVITIVVLLILFSVTIVALTGNNGIFKKAILSKENTEQAKIKEKETLNGYAIYGTREQITVDKEEYENLLEKVSKLDNVKTENVTLENNWKDYDEGKAIKCIYSAHSCTVSIWGIYSETRESGWRKVATLPVSSNIPVANPIQSGAGTNVNARIIINENNLYIETGNESANIVYYGSITFTY